MNEKLKENLNSQLSELEMLESIFYNPGELRIEDINALNDIKNFVNGSTTLLPPFLDIIINLNIDNAKFELCANLSHDYPEVEPDIYIRNSKLNRTQHAKLNKDLTSYISSLDRGEPFLYSITLWVQENALEYIVPEEVVTKAEECKDELVRYWIYSHHIYSKTKRREILNLAQTLKLTGFCMPGKPGVICVEGSSTDCNEWWQTIKAMNWKRIFLKISEECKEDSSFLKFKVFEEVAFQSSGNKCNHMDIAELHRYLETHNCSYIFKELFGVDDKNKP